MQEQQAAAGQGDGDAGQVLGDTVGRIRIEVGQPQVVLAQGAGMIERQEPDGDLGDTPRTDCVVRTTWGGCTIPDCPAVGTDGGLGARTPEVGEAPGQGGRQEARVDGFMAEDTPQARAS